MAESKSQRQSAEPQSDLPAPPEELKLSRDARASTYKEITPDSDINPPPGPQVEQTLGQPQEASN